MVSASPSIAIIGAGVTGLTCAMELTAVGANCVVFDKGRGLGGRLATRRADGGFQFDHGAPFVTAEGEGFAGLLRSAEAAGAVARWPDDSDVASYVGLPGMTGLAKYMAGNKDVRKATRIDHMVPDGDGWVLSWDGGQARFDIVVITTPAPQTVNLLPSGHALANALDGVCMDPCLTLMVGFPKAEEEPHLSTEACDAIAWIAYDSDKPGRPDMTCVVAHASTAWSKAHLELDLDKVPEHFLPLVLERLQRSAMTSPTYVSAHRWRYARASRALGQSYLANESNTLFIGGDWCLGDRAEHAWQSGHAIAQEVARHLKG